MGKNVTNGLFGFLMIILLLPLVQQCFPFITSAPLKGIFPLAEDTTFSIPSWADGSYQKEKALYTNDHLGFRADIIRFTNQAYYTLIKKINHRHVVEGAGHNLFLNNYIDAYYGKDFLGYALIHERVRKLKAIQDTITKLGKLFVAVYSPAKAYIYPEKFPEDLKLVKTKDNNYDVYKRCMDSAKINLINFNEWFIKIKNTAPEPIWSTLGIHWSIYGSYLAGDSLINYFEQKRHIHMLHARWDKIEHTTVPRYNEHDISALMNMIYPIATVPYSYPEVYYPADATAVKPKLVFIGDSFLIAWVMDGFLDTISSDWEIWYYFRDKLEKRHHETVTMLGYDWPKAIENTDYVIFMYTADNSDELGQGFIETAYAHYYPGKP